MGGRTRAFLAAKGKKKIIKEKIIGRDGVVEDTPMIDSGGGLKQMVIRPSWVWSPSCICCHIGDKGPGRGHGESGGGGREKKKGTMQ